MQVNAIVFIDIGGGAVPAGQISITEDGRYSRCEFAYGRRYLQRADAVAIDPVHLPLGTALMEAPDGFPLFNGVRDAAPDAWGRKLIDRESLRSQGRPATEAEFLLVSQSGNRIGALRFGPTPLAVGPVLPLQIDDQLTQLGDLEAFQEMVDRIEPDRPLPPRFIDFLAPGTDLGGARPKGTVTIDGFPHLVKFGLSRDRYNMAAVEAGCLDLCEMAGIPTCARQVIRVGDRDALILRRFDREEADGGVQRRHMISALTLLGAHESDRGLSGYADLYDGLRRHAVAGDHGEAVFRRMVMNVLCGNTDDHYRNTALLLSERGRYELSPLYDVTPTLQSLGTRNLFLHLGRAGSGREATLENAVAAGPSLGIRPDRAERIVNDLSQMVGARWREVLSARGASEQDLEMVANSFSEAGRRVSTAPEPGMN
jgi:serine/threonine-protein kinase HipA